MFSKDITKETLFDMLMPGRVQLFEINNFNQKIIQDFWVNMWHGEMH